MKHSAQPRLIVWTSSAIVVLLAITACSSATNGSVVPSDRQGGDPDGGDEASGDASSSSRDAGREPPPDVPAKYASHTINFDELKAGSDVTNQYAQWVTISSIPGCALQTAANYDFGQSKPNYVTTYFSCNAGSTADVTFTFAKPVKKIAFRGIGVNGSARVATMKLTFDDNTTSEAPLTGKGSALTPLAVSVPAAKPVRELVLTEIDDAYGIGLDDLSFEFPE